MTEVGTFPFGRPVRALRQQHRSTKKVFILGVYASAVHARWVGPDGRQLVRALAVDAEPYIFWRGDGVEGIIAGVDVPESVGHLEPADPKFNGPSGVALDDLFIAPLGLAREDAWLCDLVPYSCSNDGQVKAIKREYEPRREEHGLPRVSVPSVPSEFADETRCAEIVEEILESEAEMVLLLGDEPIRWFLARLNPTNRRLSDFGDARDSYGRAQEVNIGGRRLRVVPLVHPRQAAGLGRHSPKWRCLHNAWTREVAPSLL